jgi:hypothetical protein
VISVNDRLEQVARRINWFTPAHHLLSDVHGFLTQVMARGDIEDIVTILDCYSLDDLRSAYLDAPSGLFTKRAWAYWGLVLLNDAERPMPERFPGANGFDWRRAT